MRNKRFLVLLLAAALLILNVGGVFAAQQIVIGQNGIMDLSQAMRVINRNPGDVTIRLMNDLVQRSEVVLPTDIRGLKSLTIDSYYNSPVYIDLNGSVICAGGVPFTLGKNVTITNGFIIGGKCLSKSGKETVSSTNVTINGAADYVFGGGLAMVRGAVSVVDNSNVTINGSANLVHGGGYAYDGGQADINRQANVQLSRNSFTYTTYGGGYANGMNSVANTALATVSNSGSSTAVYADYGWSVNGGTANVGQPQKPVTPQYDGGGQGHGWGWDWQQKPYQPQAQNTTINVGSGNSAATLYDAMNQIPMNAGNVVINLNGVITENKDVTVPDNRGINSLTIQANGSAKVIWKDENTAFYANGVPVTIERGVTFENGIIYGGANVGVGAQSYLQSTSLNIRGTVTRVAAGSKVKGVAASGYVNNTYLNIAGTVTGWVYNGGYAMYGGYAVVDGTATLITEQGSSVQQSIAGGGISFGEGSQSLVQNANLQISGSVVYAVYLGGYADQKGYSGTNGTVSLTLLPTGNVGQSVWYGGRAFQKSSVYTAAATATIQGRVGQTVHQEGRGTDGATATIGKIF